jgi:hypothetical protein
MATIVKTSMAGNGVRTMTETTLTGTADTFTYTPARRAILVLRNPTGGALTPIIDGAGGTTVPVAGVGNVDVSGGYAVGSIPAGQSRVIPLDTISEYLKGAIAITGGTGLVASLLEY